MNCGAFTRCYECDHPATERVAIVHGARGIPYCRAHADMLVAALYKIDRAPNRSPIGAEVDHGD